MTTLFAEVDVILKSCWPRRSFLAELAPLGSLFWLHSWTNLCDTLWQLSNFTTIQRLFVCLSAVFQLQAFMLVKLHQRLKPWNLESFNQLVASLDWWVMKGADWWKTWHTSAKQVKTSHNCGRQNHLRERERPRSELNQPNQISVRHALWPAVVSKCLAFARSYCCT